jgi:uncharacterized protein YqjF (DUF2071 family)
MLSFLKNHPFGVKAFFENSLVITFAVPKEELSGLIPACLSLDTFDDKWAFIAVAMVQTRALRPEGFPKLFGNDFFLIGYRLFVRYTNNAGKRLRGLYILRSETDKKKMELFGNIFTHYNYSTTDISRRVVGAQTTIRSVRSKFEAVVSLQDRDITIPADSPFRNWKEARRFAGPLPFTFTYNETTKMVTIIEGVREDWQPEPIKVIKYDFSFLNELNLRGVVLANAFMTSNVPYRWKKGKIEKWNG